MAKLTYGSGNCSVDSCRAIQIEYRGAIQMTDKTSHNFVIHLNSHRIIIYPLGQGLLTDLFDYVGEFKVVSVKAVDSNAEFLPITIDAQTDFTETSSTNPEDSTINIEDIDSTYIVGEKIGKTLLLLSKKDNQAMANNFLNNYNRVLSGSVTASMQQSSQISSISRGTSY